MIRKFTQLSGHWKTLINFRQTWIILYRTDANLVVETKCKVMHVSNFPTATGYILCDNGPGQCVHLMEVDHEKDLGVWICSDL